MYLYHQHLIPFLPPKTLSMTWSNLIRTFKNWESIKEKYPHMYSYEKLWAYALLVQAELISRGKNPNSEYLNTSRLGSNLVANYFGYRILYKNQIDFALKRDVIFLDHNSNYLITSINKLYGKKSEPYNYDKNWMRWSEDYDKGKFKHVLCNGNYYSLLKTDYKYTVGDKDFLKK